MPIHNRGNVCGELSIMYDGRTDAGAIRIRQGKMNARLAGALDISVCFW